MADTLGDSFAKRIAGEVFVVVVSQIFELELIGCADEAVCEEGGDNRISQLPDLTLRIFESAVPVDHDFDMLAGPVKDLLLDIQNEISGITGEEFDLVFSGLVGAQKSVQLVAAAAVHGSSHDLIQAADSLCACCQQDPLGALAGVDIAVENVVSIRQDRSGLICKDDLCLGAAGADQVTVILDVINTGELVAVYAEELSVFFKGQDIAVGIDSGGINLIQADQLVADFVGRIAQHEDDLLCTHSDTAQADCKAVSGKNGEDHTYGLTAQLGPYICRNIIDTAVIAL